MRDSPFTAGGLDLAHMGTAGGDPCRGRNQSWHLYRGFRCAPPPATCPDPCRGRNRIACPTVQSAANGRGESPMDHHLPSASKRPSAIQTRTNGPIKRRPTAWLNHPIESVPPSERIRPCAGLAGLIGPSNRWQTVGELRAMEDVSPPSATGKRTVQSVGNGGSLSMGVTGTAINGDIELGMHNAVQRRVFGRQIQRCNTACSASPQPSIGSSTATPIGR